MVKCRVESELQSSGLQAPTLSCNQRVASPARLHVFGLGVHVNRHVGRAAECSRGTRCRLTRAHLFARRRPAELLPWRRRGAASGRLRPASGARVSTLRRRGIRPRSARRHGDRRINNRLQQLAFLQRSVSCTSRTTRRLATRAFVQQYWIPAVVRLVLPR
ncbi:uncharacterized protein LOC134531024 isoform X2 [Bacillus rossius redtenbacheri]|uniref:uncharacterized protein LOC134531024 isoform X2 n=1 Tax=Bacillus rossius redtenbacheri TaxID=93214 RepID=UPI002FDE85AC